MDATMTLVVLAMVAHVMKLLSLLLLLPMLLLVLFLSRSAGNDLEAMKIQNSVVVLLVCW